MLRYDADPWGGFVNHPEDPASATNLGVTKSTMQQYLGHHISMGEMKSLTQEDVKWIYRKLYVDKVRFDDLPSGLGGFRLGCE